jgi:hypothetical protein
MYCPHQNNPNACLKCYHAKVNAQPRSQAKPRAQVPNTNAIIQAVKTANGGVLSQKEVEPTIVQPPQHVGFDQATGKPIEPKVRGPMPKPVLAPGTGGGQPGTPAQGGRVLAPYSYADEPKKQREINVAGQKMMVDVAPKRRELIDTLPRHPHS